MWKSENAVFEVSEWVSRWAESKLSLSQLLLWTAGKQPGPKRPVIQLVRTLTFLYFWILSPSWNESLCWRLFLSDSIVPHLKKMLFFLSSSLAAAATVRERKPQEVTTHSASFLPGLPLATEIHILEESLETMRVGELGWRLWTRNFVWPLGGFTHKPKNVATISNAFSSQTEMET